MRGVDDSVLMSLLLFLFSNAQVLTAVTAAASDSQRTIQ